MNCTPFLRNKINRWNPLFVVLVFLSAVQFSSPHPVLADLNYQVTGGYFSSSNGAASENLQGVFTVRPSLTLTLPDGSIIYPNPPAYNFGSLDISSNSQTIEFGIFDGSLPMVAGISYLGGNFGYNDQTANHLGMAPICLERTVLDHGFNQGKEYWRYSERSLVPVESDDPAFNSLSYDSSGNFYPSGIHFTYDLRNHVGEVIEASYPPGMLGPKYQIITEADTSLGTLVFDASPVPLPGAVYLLGSGMIGMACVGRRLKQKGNLGAVA